jgi:NTP pyrophosphatase (non-canonical NTP hydrolase)
MDFNEYQKLAKRTMHRDGAERSDYLSMTGLGLTGEAGECADLLKKHLYHGHLLDKEQVTKELGDVLWYVAIMAETLEIPFDDVARKNIDKLKVRYPNGFTEEDSRNRVE